MWPKHKYQQTTNKWLTWQFLEPWRYEYEIFIALCTDNIHDLEKDRWLFGEVVDLDHVGIYGSKAAEDFSAFNIGLV